jgi:hypothetical protein
MVSARVVNTHSFSSAQLPTPASERKGETHAGALADPVFLHQADLFRPARQVVQFGQQFLGVGGDLHVVHGDLALFDQRAGAPAAAVDDLFVGEHGLVDRIPVHGAELLVDQPFS